MYTYAKSKIGAETLKVFIADIGEAENGTLGSYINDLIQR